MCKATLPHHKQQTIKKARPRVTFAMGRDLEVGVSIKMIQPVTLAKERDALYYTKKEKRRMRESARNVADQVYAQDNTIHPNSNSCSANSTNKLAYSSILLRAFESCQPHSPTLTDHERQLLSHWISSSHDRRGLEKCSVHGLRTAMQSKRKQAILQVIDTYETAMANHGYLSKASEQAMAQAYRKFSLASKKFAALLGQVDAEAATALVDVATEEHKEDTAPPSTKELSTTLPLAMDCEPQLPFHSSAAA